MFLSRTQFDQAFKNCKEKEEWYNLFAKILPDTTINTPIRLAHFLSQCAHESADFNTIIENLNYSRDGLMSVFPKYFNIANVDAYAKKPEKIANKVYANRMGNSAEDSGDGWKYRGRGIIQLTGKTNYINCSKSLFGDDTMVTSPEKLLIKEYAIRAAIWFWESNGLNKYADADDVVGLTKRINGGTIGIAHRTSLLSAIKKTLQ